MDDGFVGYDNNAGRRWDGGWMKGKAAWYWRKDRVGLTIMFGGADWSRGEAET